MARYGWRPFFIVLGMLSMAWLIPWFAWMPRGGTAISPAEESGEGFLKILTERSMWGTCGGLFGANYVLYFEITWLPYYLVHERHLSMGTMAKIGGVGYLCYSTGAVVFGWISDRWIAAGGSPTLVRKTFAGVGAGSAGLLLLGCALASPMVSVILLLLAFAAGGMCGSNIWAITQTLAGPRMAGRWPLDGFPEFRRESCWRNCASCNRIRRQLHGTVHRGLRDYGGRRDVGCVFLFLCDWPGEGDCLGNMTPERSRRAFLLIH